MAGTFTRNQAKMIAEELYKLIRSDISTAAKDLAETSNEEFISLKEAAMMLGMSASCLYKNKDQYGCYTTINRRIFFAKTRLKNTVLNNKVKERVVKDKMSRSVVVS